MSFTIVLVPLEKVLSLEDFISCQYTSYFQFFKYFFVSWNRNLQHTNETCFLQIQSILFQYVIKDGGSTLFSLLCNSCWYFVIWPFPLKILPFFSAISSASKIKRFKWSCRITWSRFDFQLRVVYSCVHINACTKIPPTKPCQVNQISLFKKIQHIIWLHKCYLSARRSE